MHNPGSIVKFPPLLIGLIYFFMLSAEARADEYENKGSYYRKIIELYSEHMKAARSRNENIGPIDGSLAIDFAISADENDRYVNIIKAEQGNFLKALFARVERISGMSIVEATKNIYNDVAKGKFNTAIFSVSGNIKNDMDTEKGRKILSIFKEEYAINNFIENTSNEENCVAMSAKRSNGKRITAIFLRAGEKRESENAFFRGFITHLE